MEAASGGPHVTQRILRRKLDFFSSFFLNNSKGLLWLRWAVIGGPSRQRWSDPDSSCCSCGFFCSRSVFFSPPYELQMWDELLKKKKLWRIGCTYGRSACVCVCGFKVVYMYNTCVSWLLKCEFSGVCACVCVCLLCLRPLSECHQRQAAAAAAAASVMAVVATVTPRRRRSRYSEETGPGTWQRSNLLQKYRIPLFMRPKKK